MKRSANMFEKTWVLVLTLIICCAGLFWLTFRAHVSQSNGDARLSLLVSLAIIEYGSVKLDPYVGQSTPPLTDPDNERQLARQAGHLYYAFPLGTSLVAVPVVWLADQLGRDLTIVAEQNRLQNGLAALSTAAIFLLVYFLGRSYIAAGSSLLLALLLTGGSMLVSTLGTALWSHHLAAGATLSILLLLSRRERGLWASREKVAGLFVGVGLFLGYLARPSLAIFVALLLIYLFWRHRPLFLPAAGSAGLLLGLFILWSWLEFGDYFPFYYRPDRLATPYASDFLTALYGQLLSPSRGLLVFVPYLLPILVYVIWRWPQLTDRHWFFFVGIWALLQVIISYQAAPWWSGWSYGPRIQLDFWPGLILLIFIVWPEFSQGAGHKIRLASFFALGVVAIWIHSYQGLYNIHTARWNGVITPDIDVAPEIALDWRYPQIGTDGMAICQRHRDYVQSTIGTVKEPLPLDEAIGLGHGGVVYVGWSQVSLAQPLLWSECEQTAIDFYWAEAAGSHELELELVSLHTPTVQLYLNDDYLTKLDFGADLQPARWQVSLGEELRPGINQLSFRVPGAGQPSPTAPYRSGVGLQWWAIRPGPAP